MLLDEVTVHRRDRARIHLRRAPSAALVVDGRPVRLEYEAVWRKDLLVADHAKAFVRHLRTVVPRLVRGGAVE